MVRYGYMALPILTTGEDVTKLLAYLKTKATGATVNDIAAALGKSLVDGRKINAYSFLGITNKEDGKIALTPLGRELARTPEATRSTIYQRVLKSIPAYNGALEWMFHQKLEAVTAAEIGSHWFQNSKSDIGGASETTLGFMAVCFMNICGIADLGKLTVGRKGKPTRLDINKSSLAIYIENLPPGAPEGSFTPDQDDAQDGEGGSELPPPPPFNPPPVQTERPKPIFIAHGKNKGPLDQLTKILDSFQIPYKVAGAEPNAGKLIPDKVKGLMRECGSAIFIFTGDEGKAFLGKRGKPENERQVPNLNVVFELGAASMLYSDRIIIFKEEGVEFASDFSSIGYIPFSNGDISSKSGDLMKELLALGFIKITTAG